MLLQHISFVLRPLAVHAVSSLDGFPSHLIIIQGIECVLAIPS